MPVVVSGRSHGCETSEKIVRESMEIEFARRRIGTIAGHFAGGDDFSAGSSCLLPLNCSSSLSSAVTRYDHKVFFARQASSTQSTFMRQASSDLGNPCSGDGNALEAPLFSRPAATSNNAPNLSAVKNVEEDCRFPSPAELPRFARPRSKSDKQKLFGPKEDEFASESTKGAQWSTRKNVAEFKHKYVVSVELPGVTIGDVRVEVNAKSLVVTARRRTTKWTKVGCCPNNVCTTSYQREILQGPYQVVWPLPADVNKHAISAELVEGVLQINVPKL